MGREWIYELKLDGFRGVLHVERGCGHFVSKRGRVMARFQALAYALARELPARSAILDGEIVVMGEKGPDFNALFFRRGKPEYVAFDLLWMNGRDLRSLTPNRIGEAWSLEVAAYRDEQSYWGERRLRERPRSHSESKVEA